VLPKELMRLLQVVAHRHGRGRIVELGRHDRTSAEALGSLTRLAADGKTNWQLEEQRAGEWGATMTVSESK
jgi:hypothetical protein